MKRNIGLPYSEETEELVLGTLINTRDSLVEVDNLLNEDCFYINLHRKIYRIIKEIDSKGERYDVMAVWNKLRSTIDENNENKERVDYLQITTNQCFDLPQHAMELNRLMAQRKNYELAQYLLSTVHFVGDPYEVQEEVIKRIQGIQAEQVSGVTTLRDAIEEVYNTINNNLNNPEPVTGTPTGFRDLDARGILRPANLTVIAADSSQGKTSLAISICMNAAKYGTKIAFYTMEMTPEELATRMLSKESGIGGRAIVSSPLTRDELVQIDRSIQKVINLSIYFDGRSTSSIDTIISSIRMMKKRYDIDGAVIDYLQILNINNGKDAGNDEQRMGIAARRLKNIAKDLKIWVLALSQLNRDKTDVAPNLYRIRGSGQITEAADNVLLLYRPEYYGRDKRYPEPYANVSTENTAMIDIAKGRNIGLMKMICGFNAATTQFYDLLDIPHIKPTSEEQPF